MNVEGISSSHLPEVTDENHKNISHYYNNMSTAAVFLDIEKVFGTTWHLGLFYKLPK
jgi:hypothetical protein